MDPREDYKFYYEPLTELKVWRRLVGVPEYSWLPATETGSG